MANKKIIKKKTTTKIVKKTIKQTKVTSKKAPNKFNKFLFGHKKINRNDILEVIMFLAMAIFMLFVYLKVQEII
ncbi:hypothetical protein GQ473_05405 [archaeon]|nr:hypothetical protein [archaeon]